MDSQYSKALLENYQNSDSKAAFDIHSRYAQRLYALARSRIGNRLAGKLSPDDIVQTAFLAFFTKADRNEVFWNKEGDLWRLLAAICVNHVKRETEYHGAAKRNVATEQSWDSNFAPRFDQAGSEHLAELMKAVIEKESPLTERVFKARLAGFKIGEIASQTGRSERTVRRVIQSIKAKIAMMSEMNIGSFLTQDVGQKSEQQKPNFNAQYENFDLLRMLGAGAFGKVYLAQNRKTNSLVAVKALRRSWLGDVKAESLFLNEARMLDSIDHPNVVKFLDAGPLPNGSWFIVMEYAEGIGLDRAIKNETKSHEVIPWLHQICLALDEIHGMGMMHGDLKPSNVIVANDPVLGRRTARLIDFGFSKQTSDLMKAWIGGTTGYVAPERISSPAADVFAFGRIIDFILREANTTFSSRANALLIQISAESSSREPDQRPTAFKLAAILAKAWDFESNPLS